MEKKFGVCLTCIDGRIQLPTIKWITQNYNVNYVDIITEPGMDGLLADYPFDPSRILKNLTISINKHNSDIIFIVGHYDCAANPVKENVHSEQIMKCVNRIANYTSFCSIVGLYVSEDFLVKKITEENRFSSTNSIKTSV